METLYDAGHGDIKALSWIYTVMEIFVRYHGDIKVSGILVKTLFVSIYSHSPIIIMMRRIHVIPQK